MADRFVLAVALAVALASVATRAHNVVAHPAIHDWDAGGHAVNVIDLLDGRWPDVRSWCGGHPPLYYATSALAWLVLPDAVPVHVAMRALSATAWTASVGLVWWWLKRRGRPADAAVVAVLLLATPGFTIASGMMTNDALCALFVTATLLRLLDRRAGVPRPWDAAVTGALAGLAALAKATGLAAVGMGAACYAWRSRRAPAAGARALAAFALAVALVAGFHYARLFLAVEGSPYDVLATRATSQEKDAIADVVHAVARRMTSSSFAGLLHTALWGDPTAVFLPRDLRAHVLSVGVWWGGLVVAVVALAGLVRLLARRERVGPVAVAMLFGAAYAAALVPHVVDRPYIVLTKTNYLLPEALPLGVLLAAGIGWLHGAAATALRAALLAVAAGGVALTSHGWWESSATAARPAAATWAATSPAAATVARYVQDRADDPIRAALTLAPGVHLSHDLRLAPILGLPPLPAEPDRGPDAARALELARARVAWLELYNLVEWFQPVATALDVRLLEERTHGDAAEVIVRIADAGTGPPDGGDIGLWPFPPFQQRFELERRDRAWRITSVAQAGVMNENALQAFVAHPTFAGFEHLRAIGWEPAWERAVTAVLQGR